MILKGSVLNDWQRRQVLDAFMYRPTHEAGRRWYGGRCPMCATNPHPYKPGRNYTEAGRKGAAMSQEEWHAYHIPIISDTEWLAKHAFKFTKDGRLAVRGHAMSLDEIPRGGKRRHSGIDKQADELRKLLK